MGICGEPLSTLDHGRDRRHEVVVEADGFDEVSDETVLLGRDLDVRPSYGLDAEPKPIPWLP
jgi:hypothetical protein